MSCGTLTLTLPLTHLAERELRHVLDEDGRVRLGDLEVVVGAQGLPTWLGLGLGLGLGSGSGSGLRFGLGLGLGLGLG